MVISSTFLQSLSKNRLILENDYFFLNISLKTAFMGSHGKNMKLPRIFGLLVYPLFDFISIFKGLYHTSTRRWIFDFWPKSLFFGKNPILHDLTPCVYKLCTSLVN